MTDDLISRSALMEAFENNIDTLKATHITYDFWCRLGKFKEGKE